MDGPDRTIGDRIRELRRGVYTQVDLAVAADVSVDVIRKLEQGCRLTASIGTLQRIARALDVELAALLGSSRPAVLSTGEEQARILAIRDALTSVDALLGELDDAEAPDLSELGRAVSYGWGAYWSGRYGLLASMLPGLVSEAQSAVHGASAGGRDAELAVDLSVQVHQLTANTLVRLDDADLGHTAAREAVRLSIQGADPLRDAASRCTLGHVLLSLGRYVDAERVTVATAETLQPHGEVSMAQLSVYGGLLLGGATAAARERRTGRAIELLDEASIVAERTGADRTDYEVVFGTGNVIMQSTDVAVVSEDYDTAAKVARRMPRDAVLPLVARSRHLVDVAHAQVRLGRYQAAESVLLSLEQAAPEWTSCHRLPRILVSELLTHGRPSTRLRELSQRLRTRRLAHQ